MNYNTLPNTNLKVSELCLGTMTFGQQNTEAEGHAQIDFALDKGINFIDTAEMYPVPAREKTTGETERIIGSWLHKSGKRNDIILASKIAGPNRGMQYIREDLAYNKETIKTSVEKSLKRLQTDYIDLYQLHWPERKSNMFGQRGFKIQEDAWEDNMKAILEVFQELIQEGKIRAIGVSNETPWGVMRFLEESKKHGLPRIATIQNPYSLLNRTFEVGLSETAYRENVGLLAYSPLAFGVLSGKFLTGEKHPDARLNLFPNFTRYNSQQTKEATALYHETATRFGLTLTEMSLAFIRQQQFVTATIIGATNLKQLEENINSRHTVLSEEVLKAIDEIQSIRPNPAP
ncbi:MAG: NADP(H)-dependent aldo-keto reductase [Flavobacterium lindanitolerans]|uniref:NADP(H)-dependent aldo-keto reductase n=1 Tax=Flavobacterium lindanitolerans TaxID=428988 RepID=UPI001A52C7D5|nr:NADP(H)-dependent aldo-keto reductase [Flavobacterium lindanitolerans]MBL7868439.1 NADP(H)-dependent aldo-keto reductase [Flavobacterium lindanitolerans]